MNFSYEELFTMYGQYDSFVYLEFIHGTEEYSIFGNRLMGTFLYEIDERRELEEIQKEENIPRTDKKVKFKASELEKLSEESKELLDRTGIQSSSIYEVAVLNKPRKNRFSETGKKDIPNQINLKLPKISGWPELNRMQFGFLSSRYKYEKILSPHEEYEYWGFRKHFNIDLEQKDYLEMLNRNEYFLKKVRQVELEAKYHEMTLKEEEVAEFVKLTFENISEKKEIINREIQRSSQNITTVVEQYNSELEELKKCCNSFDEEVFSYGEKLVYLSFERFVHIYARHVSESQIGERFSGTKTVFQYKLDDIKSLLQMVIDSVSGEIIAHFKASPDLAFKRIGKRAVYIDGHYYRLVIEPNGSILDFHPYNQNEE